MHVVTYIYIHVACGYLHPSYTMRAHGPIARERSAERGEQQMPDDDEYMTAREAQDYLGVSNRKMTDLLMGQQPALPWVRDSLDKRIKLVKRADVEKLAATSAKLR